MIQLTCSVRLEHGHLRRRRIRRIIRRKKMLVSVSQNINRYLAITRKARRFADQQDHLCFVFATIPIRRPQQDQSLRSCWDLLSYTFAENNSCTMAIVILAEKPAFLRKSGRGVANTLRSAVKALHKLFLCLLFLFFEFKFKCKTFISIPNYKCMQKDSQFFMHCLSQQGNCCLQRFFLLSI